jgi:putative endonuclease
MSVVLAWRSISRSTSSPQDETEPSTWALPRIFVKRVWEHKLGCVEGFTKEYDVKQLVWYDVCDDAITAITREKQIKKWNRGWKLKLIEQKNPEWHDLFPDICD